MIHISTVHYRSDKWIDIQSRYLKRHIREPFRVYAVLNGIDRKYFRRFFFASDYQDKVNNLNEYLDHRDKLNFLAGHIIKGAQDEDILVFLDGDAFPIAGLDSFLNDKLRHYEIVAIRGGHGPHPSFYATKVKTWKELKGRWGLEEKWFEKNKGRYDAPIENLLVRVIKEDTRWYILLRTNKKNLHKTSFGIYGDVIYHHFCSFRGNMVSPRLNLISRSFLRLPVLRLSGYFTRGIIKVLRAKKDASQDLLNKLEEMRSSFERHIISRELFKKIESDEHFYRELIDE